MFRLIAITSILLLFSCGTDVNKIEQRKEQADNGRIYKVIKVNGCEYLYSNGVNRDAISHKGNCKQCREVRKKEINEALKLLLHDPRFRHLRK